ncbi:ABC-type transport system, involved in lipoprotein release, permease component [Dyadobacter soli]|uniref:ABC-type transport system, involved in lipoprotein release, permease component n=1 Tax=Dyadobacter soli TaxID=659014 RepID=A0A1G7HPD2_9BACT|nr:ABC transporter permease [Dyadobacter soli]SDF02337.1 ABC-type transport system, involved in lipoprotein release, permease component [Dyadobacter soli]
MLRNYLKIAWRNLLKNKMFSSINILGLALGMACSLLIMLWVQDEIKMDRFHENDTRLYSVMENQHYSGAINTYAATPGILAENIVKDIPEIEKASQVLWEQQPVLRAGNVFDNEKGRYVQGDFLTMFSFKLKQGDAKTALKRPDGIVISQKLADKYFKGQDPLGKAMRVDNKDDVVVTGVLDEISRYSSMKFDFMMSYDRWQKGAEWSKEWGNNGPRCAVLLAKNADVNKVNAKIKDYVKTKNKGSNVDLFLINYGESYLYSNWEAGKQNGGRIEYVRMFTIVAVFILIIACINFMNLATARSVKRAKEVGLRKVVGAYKTSLIGQFMGESILITVLALVVAIGIVLILLPGFNSLTEKQLALDFFDPIFLILLLVLTLITGLVAGSYPALFMSSLNPVTILKGALKFKPNATYFRQGLVVFQFGLSILLILSMIVIYRQIDFIQHKNLGFSQENLLYIPDIENTMSTNFESFKQALEAEPGIKSVTRSQASPLDYGSSTMGVSWPGKDTTKQLLFNVNPAGFDFVKTMGIKLLDGRDFSPSFGTDTSNYLVNEAAAKKIGYKDPVGKELTMWGKKGKIIGLMKDFHIGSLHVAIEPLIINLQPKKDAWGSGLIRVEAGRTKQGIASIEKIFKQYNSGVPFKYHFADEEFGNLYKAETVVSKLSNYFAFLAIFISCLGLFGLAAFTAEQRTKEIGVRKVLGASVSNLVGMLSADFLKLVGIAAVIAFPVAWYFLNGWLEKYAFRIDLEWWYFAVAGVAALLIALFTVSFQAIKAALMNPVKSLKSE